MACKTKGSVQTLDVVPSKPGTSKNVAAATPSNYFEEISDLIEKEIFKMKMGLSQFGRTADSDDDNDDGDNNRFDAINYNEDEEQLQLPELECSELQSNVTRRNITKGKARKIKFLRRAIELNTKMQAMLHSLESELGLKLELAQEKLVNIQKQRAEPQPPAESQQDLIKKGAYMKLRIPYFKDEKNFPCPPNADYLDKVKNGALIVMDLPRIKFWNRLDILKLEMAVKECIITELKNRIESKKFILDSKVEKGCENLDGYYKEIELLKNKLDTSKKKSVMDLLKEYPPDREFDWMRISAQSFGNNHSETECQKFWHLYTKPSINKGSWSKQEDNMLIEIAKKHNEQNWELIAKELGTSRSQYQCFIHYQSRLNYKSTLRTGPFTRDEDEKILFLVKTLERGEYIPWNKVAHHIQTRSPSQIRSRYTCSLNPNYVKGRFTENEDLFIVSGRLAYGFGFGKLAQLLKNRSAAQIRDRFHRATSILKTKVGSWTLEEDKRLMELVKIYGEKSWSKISKYICTRTRTQIRQHYNVIRNKNYDIYKIERHNRKYRKSVCEKTKTLNTTDRMKAVLDSASGGFALSEAERQHLIGESLTYVLRSKVKKGRKKPVVNSEHAQVDKELTEFFIECSSGVWVKKRNLEPEFDSLVKQMHAVCDFFLVDMSSKDVRDKIQNSSLMDDLLKRVLLKVSEEKERNRNMLLNEDGLTGNIDYIPTRDLCIVFHDAWLLEKNSALENNFSELLKAPLMEYSWGLHKDILDNIMRQNKVVIHEGTIEKEWSNGSEDVEIPYMLPPNYMSENSMRTLMLSRRKFEKVISHNRHLFNTENLVSRSDEGGDIYRKNFDQKTLTSSFVMDMPASRKFQERLLTLFHWPTIMSLCRPPTLEQFSQYLSKRMSDANSQSEPATNISQQQGSGDCGGGGDGTNESQSEKAAPGSVSGEPGQKKRRKNVPGSSFLRKNKKSNARKVFCKKRKLDKNHCENNKERDDCNSGTVIDMNSTDCEVVQQ